MHFLKILYPYVETLQTLIHTGNFPFQVATAYYRLIYHSPHHTLPQDVKILTHLSFVAHLYSLIDVDVLAKF